MSLRRSFIIVLFGIGLIAFQSSHQPFQQDLDMVWAQSPAILRASPVFLQLETRAENPNVDPQTITFTNAGDGIMEWSAYTDVDWLSLVTSSGALGAGESVEVPLLLNLSGLTAGFKVGSIIVDGNGAQGSPQAALVNLNVVSVTAATQNARNFLFNTGQLLGNDVTWRVVLGDVDGDGDLDAVAANWAAGDNKIWLNDGVGNFTQSDQVLGEGSWTYSIALGDLDGDGDVDALAGQWDRPSEVWLNDGAANFTRSQQFGRINVVADVALGDIDGDGDLDAVLASLSSNATTSIWINNGAGRFSESNQIIPANVSWDLEFADFDADGDLDLFVSNAGPGFDGAGNEIWLNDGTGNFSDSGQSLGAGRTWRVAVGDIDGDSDVDLITGNTNRFGNHVWINDGAGKFSDETPSFFPGGSPVALGDVDGDGDLDLYADANLWLNRNGRFDFKQKLGTFATRGVAFGDLNGDGKLDLFLGNTDVESIPDTPGNEVWLNQSN